MKIDKTSPISHHGTEGVVAEPNPYLNLMSVLYFMSEPAHYIRLKQKICMLVCLYVCSLFSSNVYN